MEAERAAAPVPGAGRQRYYTNIIKLRRLAGRATAAAAAGCIVLLYVLPIYTYRVYIYIYTAMGSVLKKLRC